ncbi:MAG: hypothetical protein H5T84_01830 [Thermoleophilia bacterium]|nr:hypothetical protein [Thermoleophilia bacterium]
MVTLLAVNPGWSGQSLAANVFKRIERTRQLIAASGRDILLCVDGGITLENAGEIAAAGADLVVSGSAIFVGGETAANARAMLEAVHRSCSRGGEV